MSVLWNWLEMEQTQEIHSEEIDAISAIEANLTLSPNRWAVQMDRDEFIHNCGYDNSMFYTITLKPEWHTKKIDTQYWETGHITDKIF